MESNTNYKAIRAIIHNLDQQLKDITELQLKQDFSAMRREIEEHFERAIHALEARQQILIAELDIIAQKQDTALERVKEDLKGRISACRGVEQAGIQAYQHSKDAGDKVWQGALNLGGPPLDSSSLQLRVTVELPAELLSNIDIHGKVENSPPILEFVHTHIAPKLLREPTPPQVANFTSINTVSTVAVKYKTGGEQPLFHLSSICFMERDKCFYVQDDHIIRKLIIQGSKNMGMMGELTTFFTHAPLGLRKVFSKLTTTSPSGIAISYKELCFYVFQYGGYVVRKLSFQGSLLEDESLQAMSQPRGIVVTKEGDIFITDEDSIKYRVYPDKHFISLAGDKRGFSDGKGANARFSSPTGLWYDPKRQLLLVCDKYNDKIRAVSRTGEVHTLCDIPQPSHIVGTASGNFIVSSGIHQIFVLDGEYKIIAKVGTGQSGSKDGSAEECRFNYPSGLVVHEESKSCFVCDEGNGLIRRIKFL